MMFLFEGEFSSNLLYCFLSSSQIRDFYNYISFQLKIYAKEIFAVFGTSHVWLLEQG